MGASLIRRAPSTGVRRAILPRAVVRGAVAGIVVGLCALGAVVGWGRLAGPWGRDASERLREGRRNAIVLAVERTRRSVVTIRAETDAAGGDPAADLFWYPFSPGRLGRHETVGSGFFVDDQGHLLTNEHVVRGARRIVVSLGDPTRGMSTTAELVGVSPQFDLALLRVPPGDPGAGAGLGTGPPDWAPALLGDSDDLMMGEWVIAIGSPFGFELGSLEPSVSVGVVSAVQRDLPPREIQGLGPYVEMIQTDAAIHRGNSGGPLVNAHGEVIGVNTVSYSNPSEGGDGIHFAIPINTARWVAEELRIYGEVRRPWIGWSVAEVDPQVRDMLQLPEDQGILTVTQVVRDSPADRAGIRAGDLLYRIQGNDPYSLARAERILFGTPVESDVRVELLRGGQFVTAVVHVIEDPYTRAEREARARRLPG